MAKYQNVGTPRFYVDYFQYALTTGIITSDDIIVQSLEENQPKDKILNLFYLNPAKTNLIDVDYFTQVDLDYHDLGIVVDTKFKNTDDVFDYIGILNHNLAQVNPFAGSQEGEYTEENFGFTFNQGGSNYFPLSQNQKGINKNAFLNGFTFIDLKSNLPQINIQYPDKAYFNILKKLTKDLKLGCLTGGNYYDMPHSPDLDLTLTREYGGSSKQFTKGGNLLTNYNYTQQPTWGEAEAWGTWSSLNLQSPQKRRAGRRRWDLKFSYIASSDLMAEIETLDSLALDGITENPYDYKQFASNTDSVLDQNYYDNDKSFFTQFMQKTLGGSLRFIFQPDKTDFTPDGFAICVLDQDSISFKQVAHNTYNVSLKILEVW